MRRVGIVQARMRSRRLPGKVLADVAGRPLLEQELRRLLRCRQLDDVVVATTSHPADDPVALLAERLGFSVHRGSDEDVLGRYVAASVGARADIVVRITADCPLIDPEIVDRVIMALGAAHGLDGCSNVVRRTFPRGLDVEAVPIDVLRRLDTVAKPGPAREHVTWLLYRERTWRVRSVEDDEDNSDLRWTVDELPDLLLVRRLYADLELGRRPVGYREIVRHVRRHPELAALNAPVRQIAP